MKRNRKPGDSYPRIWETVRRIPRGKVSTYGQIASLSGLDGQARLTGYALHNLPDGLEVPWQRVINSEGMISFPARSARYQRQRRLLESEGIFFLDDKVDLERFGWPKTSRSRKRRSGSRPRR